jgi:hypothetical protein
MRSSIFSLFVLVSLTLGGVARADLSLELPAGLRPELNLPGVHSNATSVINVLDYVRQNVTHDTIADLDTKTPGYNRRENFGGWITVDGCVDTRGQVLIRSNDASTPLEYKDARECVVVKGLWHDPYAGDDYKLAKAVQIDHVVPLKHVYLTGGSKWAPEKRCYYANFTHNDFHLLAVSGHENMAKADKSPEFYLPPMDSFQCEYVADWMKVKTIWQLISTAEEVAAIEDVVRTHHCSLAKLQMSDSDLAEERDAISSTLPTRCQEFGNLMWSRAVQLELPFGEPRSSR